MSNTPIHTSNANLVAVSTTALASTVRLQVWDELTLDAEGDPVRQSDVRLTVDQALALIADLTQAVQGAAADERLALQSIIRSRTAA
jgi:hypothetical protein